MFVLALAFYFLDFISWIYFEQWLVQSFFILLLISWFSRSKQLQQPHKHTLFALMLIMQSTIRYGSFLVATTTVLTLYMGLFALQTFFDTTKPFYPHLFLAGFYLFEFLMIKKWALSLIGGGYFTYKVFLVNLILMSFLMGMRGNRFLRINFYT